MKAVNGPSAVVNVQSPGGPNRHARRAARALGTDREQTVTCNVCKGLVWKGPMGRSLAARAREVQRAFVAHCRISGCVKSEDIEPVECPE